MKYLKLNGDYINHIRKYECRIPYHDYGPRHFKPFIGPLFEINGLVYVTHLTHYKPEKHDMIKGNSKLMHVIKDLGDHAVSVVNLAAMFPVPKDAIEEVDLEHLENYRDFSNEIEKVKFSKFLKIQLSSIKKQHIADISKDVYARSLVFDDFESKVVDFGYLEDIVNEWTLSNEVKRVTQDNDLEV